MVISALLLYVIVWTVFFYLIAPKGFFKTLFQIETEEDKRIAPVFIGLGIILGFGVCTIISFIV